MRCEKGGTLLPSNDVGLTPDPERGAPSLQSDDFAAEHDEGACPAKNRHYRSSYATMGMGRGACRVMFRIEKQSRPLPCKKSDPPAIAVSVLSSTTLTETAQRTKQISVGTLQCMPSNSRRAFRFRCRELEIIPAADHRRVNPADPASSNDANGPIACIIVSHGSRERTQGTLSRP